jgi:hypothetical protein
MSHCSIDSWAYDLVYANTNAAGNGNTRESIASPASGSTVSMISVGGSTGGKSLSFSIGSLGSLDAIKNLNGPGGMGESSSGASFENMAGIGTDQGVSVGIASNSSRSYSSFSSFRYLTHPSLLLAPILEEDEPKDLSLSNNGIGTTYSHATKKRKTFQTTTTGNYNVVLAISSSSNSPRSSRSSATIDRLKPRIGSVSTPLKDKKMRREEQKKEKERKDAIEMLHAKSPLESLGSAPGADEFGVLLQ